MPMWLSKSEREAQLRLELGMLAKFRSELEQAARQDRRQYVRGYGTPVFALVVIDREVMNIERELERIRAK